MSSTLRQMNTRSLLTWLPLVMLVASVFLYLLLTGHVRHMQQEQQDLRQRDVWRAFTGAGGDFPLCVPAEYDIEEVSAGAAVAGDRRGDTSFSFPETGPVALKLLAREHRFDNRRYLLTTYVSKKEFTHLLIKISVAEGIIFLLLLCSIILINRKTSIRLWASFYRTLNEIRDYDVRQDIRLPLIDDTGITEFDQLNGALLSLLDRVNRAYHTQKQFTENAAHELQTPVAIIRSKVELLMDAPMLDAETAQLLAEITEANERLSQLNKNLLLLARIDNRQFPDVQLIILSDLLERLVSWYRNGGDGEMVRIGTSIRPGVKLAANPTLLEILVGNLLRNAFFHNIPGGFVEIRLEETELVIRNSGPMLEVDPDRLFDRFRKGREDSRTTGLGLALVRQICELYGFRIQYEYSELIHQLRLSFPAGVF